MDEMPNPVLHWQILTKQVDRLEQFYSDLFGWKFSSDNDLGYRMASNGTPLDLSGGLWPIGPEGHSMVQLFVKVDDVAAFAERAERLGGRIVIPRQQLPSGAQIAVAVDPDGIAFAIFEGAGLLPL
jgi:predicted enzyme related to lactoylglutathione lyase